MTVTDASSRIDGPGWADKDVNVYSGRYPLAVENHTINWNATLVPGATTVTTGGRYFSLHGAVAAEVARRNLDRPDALDLLRRCEVVVAGISELIRDDRLPAPHGGDAVRLAMRTEGQLDVSRLSTPGDGYSIRVNGYLNPYTASENLLRIIDGELLPGERLDEQAVAAGFAGLFDLAAQDRISREELLAHPHLAVGAAADQPDGQWLARLFCAYEFDDADRADETRRNTIRILARSLLLDADRAHANVESAFRNMVAYGPAGTDDQILAGIPETMLWRGSLYRHQSVGAWRRLWSWMVEQMRPVCRYPDLVGALADELGPGSLGDFIDSLPSTLETDGNPAPAERMVNSDDTLTVPQRCLGLVAIGGRRSHESEGHVHQVLVGDPTRILSPAWIDAWLTERRSLPLRDVANDLTGLLVRRAIRLAQLKMSIRKNGRVVIPSSFSYEDGLLIHRYNEGRGNVGLRLIQLAGILTAVGVLDPSADQRVTDQGLTLLDVT